MKNMKKAVLENEGNAW